MTTKTIQFTFKIGSVLTDATNAVMRDPTAAFGVRRTDTNAIIVAAGVAMTHLATGLYACTFTEPTQGLNYEYWVEFVYLGITKRVRGVLETSVSTVPVAPSSTYQTLGLTTVACGDATLQAFLTTQSDLVWAMQARRGVALDLQYQYYVSDLLVYAMDYTRMLIDQETGTGSMSDRATMDALNTSSANSTTTKTRTSSFTESSSSAQNWARNASRNSSSSATLNSSNSSSRTSSSYDYSTVSQSASGSSSRTQNGSSTTLGSLTNPDTGARDGTSGIVTSRSLASNISETYYYGAGNIDPNNPADGRSSEYTTREAQGSASLLGLIGGNVSFSIMNGASSVYHTTTSSLKGRINPIGLGIDERGSYFDLSNYSTSSSQHARGTTGLQVGAGSASFNASGTRINNRAGTSSISAASSTVGNSASSLTSSSHQDQTRSASSTSHSESLYNSSMVASTRAHREMLGADTMTSANANDREYYSQLFDALKSMWTDTQAIIRKLESQMLLASQYLVSQLTTTTPQNNLVQVAAFYSDRTLIQRPGIRNRALYIPYNPWIVK